MFLRAKNLDDLTARMGAELTYKGNTIEWNLNPFDKCSFENFDMFCEINSYWSTLEDKHKAEIFQIYQEIRKALDEVWDKNKLTIILYPLVARLLNLHPLNDIHHWVTYRSNIFFPDSVKNEYDSSPDSPGSREQTYIKSDYIQLVSLTLIIRTMIPIWGEFISLTKKETGTILKEYYAFQLICKSDLMHSQPMEKLTTFIDCSIASVKNNPTSIIGGISTEDFPIWLLGLILVRRLCVGDIRGVDPMSSLIPFVLKFIKQKIKGADNVFSGIVRERVPIENSAEGDSSLSKLEGYKLKQDIPTGDIVVLEYAMSDMENLAKKLAPTMDIKDYYSALTSSASLNNNPILDPQITILQWVFKPVISTRGIMFLSKTTIVKALAMCQAILWHRGHYVLSVLTTAKVNNNVDELSISGVDTRARIPRETLEELAIIFPFTKRVGGKQKTLKPINQAVTSIEILSEQISNYDWILTANQKLLNEMPSGATSRRFLIPHDIRVKVATLALEVGKRSWKK